MEQKTSVSITENLFQRLIDDHQRSRLQLSVVSALLGIISAVSCILNILQGNENLTIATMIFSLVSFINVAILAMGPKKLVASYLIFGANLLVLTAYLMIFDSTETGPLWLLLLPACGPILMGRKFSSILNSLLVVMVAILMWTPFGNAMLAGDFDLAYRIRYPIVYVCFFLVGFWLEFVRSKTYGALKDLQVQFQEMSIRDALTGIYNRHWINTEMPQVIKRCKGKVSLGVIIVDLDLFKGINDTYGHLFGDHVLKEVAKLFKEIIGEQGDVCRWGGEEFAILVEDADEEKITNLAEQLRTGVEKLELKDEDEVVNITISAGATAMIPAADMRPGFMIDCADNALYKAKDLGRNRVVFQKGSWRYRDIDD